MDSLRNLRNADVVDQSAINRNPSVIIGVGAIGSHLAEILVKLGVSDITLVDPDEVDEVNLGVQGFYEMDLGRAKVAAVAGRLLQINGDIHVTQSCELFGANSQLPPCANVFVCVDSIDARRVVAHKFRRCCADDSDSVLIDGRMAAEHLQVYTVPRRRADSVKAYFLTLFPAVEAYRESCTAKTTIYCATMAAAVMCAAFKRAAAGQDTDFLVSANLAAFDMFGDGGNDADL